MTDLNDRVQSSENVPHTYADVVRYLKNVRIHLPDAVTSPEDMVDIAPQTDSAVIEDELRGLSDENRLYTYRQFEVFVGSQRELPATIKEIARLREYTFRAFEEGSGKAVDTDDFDSTYLHLFVWDTQNRLIVGGYRLGRTDVLRREYGAEGVYLGAMFDFERSFYDGAPMLEVGRSFVVPEYQRSHSSLHLLWCGIGGYLANNPEYRRLYGVVSMSRLYDGRTIAAMRDALLEPSEKVTAKEAYQPDLGHEWRRYLDRNRPLPIREVSRLVKALELEQRDIPILIRHYHKLGARFVSAAVDRSFNNTPGLLLHIDVPTIPTKYLKRYLREGLNTYLEYGGNLS